MLCDTSFQDKLHILCCHEEVPIDSCSQNIQPVRAERQGHYLMFEREKHHGWILGAMTESRGTEHANRLRCSLTTAAAQPGGSAQWELKGM